MFTSDIKPGLFTSAKLGKTYGLWPDPTSSLLYVKEKSIDHIDIALYIDMNVGIGGDIWRAAQLFCDLITYSPQHYHYWKNAFQGKKILELGSGNGLISILLEKIYPSIESIVASDIEEHLELISENIRINNCDEEKIISKDINWFDYVNRNDENPSGEKYDVILALECVYKEELYLPLLRVIIHFMHSESVVLLGMSKSFISHRFFDICKELRIHYEKMPAVSVKAVFQGSKLYPNIQDLDNIGIFSLSVLSNNSNI